MFPCSARSSAPPRLEGGFHDHSDQPPHLSRRRQRLRRALRRCWSAAARHPCPSALRALHHRQQRRQQGQQRWRELVFRRLALSSAAPYGVVCELRCAHSTLPSSAQLLRAWQHGSSGRSASCGLVPQKQRVRCESRQRPPRRENQRSLRQVQVHSGARRRRRADRRACTQQRSAPKTWRIGAPYVLFPDAARSAAAQTGAGHHGPGGSRVELEPGAVTARLGRGKQILWTNRGRFHTKAKGPTPVLAQRRTDRGRFSMGHALSRVFPSPGSATPLVPATTGVLDSPALPLTDRHLPRRARGVERGARE